MLLRPAHLLDRAVRDRQIDLSGGRTDLLRRQPEVSEQGLDDPVVALILGERLMSLEREPALAPVPFDKTEVLERSEVTQRRGRGLLEGRRDQLEGNATLDGLVGPNDLQGLHLPSCQLLKGLHVGRKFCGKYKPSPNC